MPEQKTRTYLKFLAQTQHLLRSVLGDGVADEDRERVALCMSEIHSASKRLVAIIEDIAATPHNLTSSQQEAFLGKLCGLRVELYDSLEHWLKYLKKPLKSAISAVARGSSTDPSAAIAAKTIEKTQELIGVHMKKFKAYGREGQPPVSQPTSKQKRRRLTDNPK